MRANLTTNELFSWVLTVNERTHTTNFYIDNFPIKLGTILKANPVQGCNGTPDVAGAHLFTRLNVSTGLISDPA